MGASLKSAASARALILARSSHVVTVRACLCVSLFCWSTALILSACNNQAQDKDPTQADSDSNPNYKQAQQDLDNNNPAGAVADYEAALGANPKLAGAHYELGVIYGDKMNDPISSIYHFKRFLELSPNTDKKDQVQALIDKEGQDYAASLPNAKPQITQADLDKVNTDNAALKKQVDDANTTIAQLQRPNSSRRKRPLLLGPPRRPRLHLTLPHLKRRPARARRYRSINRWPLPAMPTPMPAAQAASTSDGAPPPAGARSYTRFQGRQLLEDREENVPGRHQERRRKNPGSQQANDGQAA